MVNKRDYSDAPPLLKDFVVYLQLVKNRSELTVLNYYSDLRTFFRFYKLRAGRVSDDKSFSDIDIADISEDDIKAVDLALVQEFLIFEKTDKNNDTKARYRKAVAIRQFFKYLTNNKGLFDVSPVANLELPTPKPALPKHLTLEQAQEMLNHVNLSGSRRDYCILTFFLNCGMRLSELVGINVGDISCTHDINGSEIYSLKVLGKGSKERIIYLNDACVQTFLAYVSPANTDVDRRKQLGCRDMSAKTDALFLSGRGTRISGRRVQQLVDKYLSECGLSNMGLSVHKLRHTAATLMYQNGVDVRVLKDVLGHESLNTTQIYTHVSNTQMQDAMMNNPLNRIVDTDV